MQVAIDGCKRQYAVDANDEIKRIRAQKCMNLEKDYPKFMKYTHKIPVTKNGRDRPYNEIKKDRDRVSNRIDENLVCPMNWMQERLEKIQGASTSDGVDIYSLMADKPKNAKASHRQMDKIRNIIEDYDAFVKYNMSIIDFNGDDDLETMKLIENKAEEVFQIVSKMKINYVTMHRLIEVSLEYDGHNIPRKRYKKASKYTVRTLSVLYRANSECFLSCFKEKAEFIDL